MRGWHHPRGKNGRMDHAARRKNDIASLYNMSDAVFTACFLNACLKHCDIVKMACFSPVVNKSPDKMVSLDVSAASCAEDKRV